MNKKLNEEQRVLVEAAKKLILILQNDQDKIFNNLINDLNVEDASDNDWIFDFIYNTGELSDDYYKMVESSIFEQN
jgi:hypothetical protein